MTAGGAFRPDRLRLWTHAAAEVGRILTRETWRRCEISIHRNAVLELDGRLRSAVERDDVAITFRVRPWVGVTLAEELTPGGYDNTVPEARWGRLMAILLARGLARGMLRKCQESGFVGRPSARRATAP